MGTPHEKYEAVIGLEVHTQLITASKAYSADRNEYGALPNNLISVISLGHPGTLPRLNKKIYESAIKLGIACQSDITEENRFDRKNYFYADLPKGYQITQDRTPICRGGHVPIKLADGTEKQIRLTRIHMEEDSGKSIHDRDVNDSLIDLNRAGVPLLEIVSEPDFRSGEEAYQYLAEIRKLVRYLDICDGNMEEGSLRCDANISVRLKGATAFGRKVEVKNMNSFRNVQRAIQFEINRQIELVEAGTVVAQETRTFDASSGATYSMRSKEDANDYRYFPEPDLQPLIIRKEEIERLRDALPPLPAELLVKYTTELGLTEYAANVIIDAKPVALYFEAVIGHTSNYTAAANWLMGDVKSYLNENAVGIDRFPISPEHLGALVNLIDSGKVSHNLAAQKIFPAMVAAPGKSPMEIAEANGWLQESDTGALEAYVQQALDKYPEKVAEYKAGKVSLVGLFMGEVMKLSKGKADPKLANKLVRERLNQQ